MSERPVIFTLLTDEPPNGKLSVLSVHSFAVLLESNLKGPNAASLMTELPRPIFRV